MAMIATPLIHEKCQATIDPLVVAMDGWWVAEGGRCIEGELPDC